MRMKEQRPQASGFAVVRPKHRKGLGKSEKYIIDLPEELCLEIIYKIHDFCPKGDIEFEPQMRIFVDCLTDYLSHYFPTASSTS